MLLNKVADRTLLSQSPPQITKTELSRPFNLQHETWTVQRYKRRQKTPPH